MAHNKTFGYIFITVLAAALGYFAYQKTNALSAVFVIFAASWILYRFTSYEKTWNFFGYFLNPTITAYMALLLGATYFIYRGHFLDISLNYGLGTALIGAAVGMLIYKYWNIGEP